MNKWIGIGNLTADPELKTTQSGYNVCSFSVAITRPYKTENGESETDFIRCVAWKQTAEFICKYFKKGRKIALEGTMQVRKWTDKDGKNRESTEAIIDRVEFCDKKPVEADSNTEAAGSNNTYSGAESNDTFVLDENDEDLPF